MKKIISICLIFALMISFTGCSNFHKLVRKSEEVKNKTANSILAYEEQLHGKEFTVVDFKEGVHKTDFLGYEEYEPDELVLRYKSIEFNVSHLYNEPFDDENIWDNFVFKQECTNIKQDIETKLSTMGYDSIVDTKYMSSGDEMVCNFAGTNEKYQGIFSLPFYDQPTLRIYVWAKAETFETAKPVIQDIREMLYDLFGSIVNMHVCFFDETIWTKKSMLEAMSLYPEKSNYSKQAISFIYTTKNNDGYDCVFDVKSIDPTIRTEFLIDEV